MRNCHIKNGPRRFLAAIALATTLIPQAHAQLTVHNANELRAAVARAMPGDEIALAPGNFGHGFHFKNLRGTADRPIVIGGAAADDATNRDDLPHFSGGNQALHFADCSYVTLRNVRVSGCSLNGVNADDGGSFDSPSVGMTFENLVIEDIGPRGNHDGLKLSGLTDFTVRNCRFAGWGGSAIDMVGCRDGVIEQCRFTGKDGFSQDTGVQAKGGSTRVAIRQSVFKNAGQRAINLGGRTGLQFFRPELTNYEAKDIEVAGNTFIGGQAPIAFVTSQECRVHHNTIVHPEKWVLRILQEQPTDKFLPCQSGVFENNLIVFDRRVQHFANVGGNTKPETFQFRGNLWFDSQGQRRPTLPVNETGGVYQVDPQLAETQGDKLEPNSKDARVQAVGAHAFKP